MAELPNALTNDCLNVIHFTIARPYVSRDACNA